ncbi:CRISPR-associated helicase Cas3' [Thermanaeromonas sp. C210]|uniref:CRISPR-associated helicase Cas3' n=1 Tax=Thermanaeromonas sp. C210 TaxID=2731925 RepID=UPI00155CB7B3|nr:CRISPR-associated helicase Cas3' [Thermanaeromonas sp. C210]GFN23387.1 CRISPR-associated helicase/endonuclease Cas3 [Thermanaeromonas sp. C210]
MPFYAHRFERRYYLLSAHLAGVAVGAAGRVAELPKKEELFPAALVAGLAHDFGKYSGYFQEYLRTGRGGPEKQHALLSGLWAAYLAQRLALPPEQQLSLFLAVARHHQDLIDPEEYLVPRRDLVGDWAELDFNTRERLRVTAAQVADLQSRAGAVAVSLRTAARRAAGLLASRGLPVYAWLRGDWAGTLAEFLDNWKDAYAALYSIWRRHKREAGPAGSRHAGGTDLSVYFDLLTLFSALIDADKIHAARVGEAGRMPIPRDAIERYRATRYGRPCTAIDALREGLYRRVMERIRRAPLEQKLFTLTAPTGAGKTLAGLAAAFCLRERLAERRDIPPRIIYALPFTSIVDQTFAVGEEVLRVALSIPEGHIPNSWLLKHHHLAEPTYREAGNREAERSVNEALLLIESWQSEVVVTTFVQLFCTLVGFENRMLKKFHRLGGAVVILDEVQNIPVEYWPLVEESLRQACAHLDLRVVLMTATRPEWFSPGEALELAGDAETVRRQFAALNRVRLTADTTPRTVEEAAAAFLDQYNEGRSYLVVLNTIKSSIAFYSILRDAWRGHGPALYYLSTNIVPAERERRLAEIRECLARGEKPVVVSTQVVEAGVDLDFDAVWRDLGPVDSVVQVAGRCNRHFRREQGHVQLLHLVDGDKQGRRSLASYVYGKIHTVVAQRLFASRPCLAEPEFFEVVADYFRAVRQSKSAAESEAILQAMAALRFTKRGGDEALKGVSDFALIRELPQYVEIFVCTDAHAEAVWNQYQATVARERDIRRRWAAFLELKRDFRRYLLSVPAELLLHRLPGESHPPVIPRYLVDEFYDKETGFRRIEHEGALVY